MHVAEGGGYSVVDWAFSMKNVRSDDMTLIKLPGDSIFVNGDYRGEGLAPSAKDFFSAVRQDQVQNFIFRNPEYINTNS